MGVLNDCIVHLKLVLNRNLKKNFKKKEVQPQDLGTYILADGLCDIYGLVPER